MRALISINHGRTCAKPDGRRTKALQNALAVSTWSLYHLLGVTYGHGPGQSKVQTAEATYGPGRVGLLAMSGRGLKWSGISSHALFPEPSELCHASGITSQYIEGNFAVPTQKKLVTEFWDALASDMTMMLGLAGVEDSHARPMTAQLENEKKGPLWFFTAKDTNLVKDLKKSNRGVATFVSKGHKVFATVHGRLTLDNDPAKIDKLWNRFVAAWYEGGKDDSKLALLRFDLDRGEIWQDGSSLFAGIKMMLGADPKEDYKDNVAEVKFRK